MPSRPHPQPPDAAAALARAALLAARIAERALPPLTVAQYLALHAAAHGVDNASALADAAGVSPAAVSQLLAALETGGLIARERAADDRRRQAIALTAAGRRALTAADARVRAPLAALIDELPHREADALRRALPPLADLLAGTRPEPRRRPPPPPPLSGPRRTP